MTQMRAFHIGAACSCRWIAGRHRRRQPVRARQRATAGGRFCGSRNAGKGHGRKQRRVLVVTNVHITSSVAPLHSSTIRQTRFHGAPRGFHRPRMVGTKRRCLPAAIAVSVDRRSNSGSGGIVVIGISYTAQIIIVFCISVEWLSLLLLLLVLLFLGGPRRCPCPCP